MKKTQYLLFFIFLLGMSVGSLHRRDQGSISNHPSSNLSSTASLNPLFPDPLANDVSVPEWYGTIADYYYITDNASSTYYHVIWTHAVDPSDPFDVFLYSDSEYSNFIVASVPAMSWVVYRPITNQKLYPTVHTYSDAGDAYTEWEVVSDLLTREEMVSGTLNDSEFVETYWVSLTAGYWYNLSLTVPAGADFDLYIYSFDPGLAAGGNNYLERSDDGGVGEDERIFWEASKSGPYAIVLNAESGAGSYTFEFRSPEWQYPDSEIPLNLTFVFLSIAAVVVVGVFTRRRKDHHNVNK